MKSLILIASISFILSFVAGGSWGLNQVLYHRNHSFFSKFENVSKQFWGIDSWKNKYDDFDPNKKRNNVPIWLTDGKHLTASVTQISLILSGVFFGIFLNMTNKKFWIVTLTGIVLLFLSYSLGNYLIWDIIFS